MRSAIRQRVAGVIGTTAKCHKPFIPTKEGSYLVKKCYECGETVPADEVDVTSQSYVMTVRGAKKKQ